MEKEGGLDVNLSHTDKKWTPKTCGPNPDAPDENYISLKDASCYKDYRVPKREMKRGGRGGAGMPDDVPLRGGKRK